MKKFKALFLILALFALFSFSVMASDIELDDNELELDVFVPKQTWVASVTLNSTGDGAQIGEWTLYQDNTVLKGLYYVASDNQGTDKKLAFVRGSYEERQALGNPTPDKLIQQQHSTEWKTGIWTGNGLSLRSFCAYGTYGNKYLLSYNDLPSDIIEKYYVYSNDKTEVLNEYAAAQGEDSDAYKTVLDYYGDLDDAGIAAALKDAADDIANEFKATVARYAYESGEIIPVSELKSFKFASFKHQGSVYVDDKVMHATATFYVMGEDGIVTHHTWTSEGFAFTTSYGVSSSLCVDHVVDVQSIEGLPKKGWIVGVELNAFGEVDSTSSFRAVKRDLSDDRVGYRFLMMSLMNGFYDTEYVISKQEATPVLASRYIGDGKYRISVTNPSDTASYVYKSVNSDTWLNMEGSYVDVSTFGYYEVMAIGNGELADSSIARINLLLAKPTPELVLSDDNTITALEGVNYEYAKLSFGTTPVYQPLTSATLTTGVWAVVNKGDGVLGDSVPQYFYIEGEDTGSIVYATTTGNGFVEARWTSIQDVKTDNLNFYTWEGNGYLDDRFEIYYGFTHAHFTGSNSTTYGYRYQFKESEIVPVSTLVDLSSLIKAGIREFSYTKADGTTAKTNNVITKARVHVVGADVAYYDVYTRSTYSASYTINYELSQLKDKKGYAVAIELFPAYQIIDADGNPVAPLEFSGVSQGFRFNNVIVDEDVELVVTSNRHNGIAADGVTNKFSLKIANKAETPILSVSNAGNGEYFITVANAVPGITYKYSNNGTDYATINGTSFKVNSTGTYYVKAFASTDFLGSEVVSVTFEGTKETPALVLDENNTITADKDNLVYSKLAFDTDPDFQPLTTATLTTGVWAVKELGEGTILDSNCQYIYIPGKNAGKLIFATTTGNNFVEGRWTSHASTASLFDRDYYKDFQNAYKSESIEIYYNIENKYFADGSYKQYGFKYKFRDSEIIPLSNLVDITALAKYLPNFNYVDANGNTKVTNKVRTKARVYVVGADVPYYDVYDYCTYSNTEFTTRFSLSTLNDKPGYAVAIQLCVMDEFCDDDWNFVNNISIAGYESYSMQFELANINMDEDVELVVTAYNHNGIAADGVTNKFTLGIGTSPFAPQLEAVEGNANAVRITNYVEGATYAWATDVAGEWTEFNSETYEFTRYGEYYIKQVEKDGFEELINYKPFKTADVVIEGASLELGAAIGIKVYFGAAEGTEFNVSYMKYDSVAEKVVEKVDVAEYYTGDAGYYIVVPIEPKDADRMQAIITITENGNVLELATDIESYVEALRKLAENGDEESIEATALVDMIESYSDYARNYFYSSSYDKLPDVELDDTALANVPAPKIETTPEFSAEFYGTSLLLEGETTIRHHFKVNDIEAFDKYKVYCNGEVLENKSSNNIYHYDISSIPANKLNTPYTLEIIDENEKVVCKVVYRVTNYIKNQLGHEDERLVNLLKTLYNYYEECDSYSFIANNRGQRKEILDAMNTAIATTPAWEYIPAYNPTKEGYENVKAITYEGFEYNGKTTKVFAYIGFPEGASADKPVPAIVLVHGGGGHAFADWVKIWNDEGYAAIAMDTTGDFPALVDGVPQVSYAEGGCTFIHGLEGDLASDEYTTGPTRIYPTTYTPVNQQWAYHGISQVILASNILRADEKVDDKNIGITGISWGGVTTAQVIGYDNRYSFAIPIYGCAYMGDPSRPFANFADPYVNLLWGSERNLDNATMPILWFSFNDDNNFGVPSYVKSYEHTKDLNEKTTISMRSGWSHSHGSGWVMPLSYVYADSITFGTPGILTFENQPKTNKVNCKLNIPEGATGLKATIHYITEPMSYANFDKWTNGRPYVYLEQYWQKDTTSLTIKDGYVTGTVPSSAAGYYVDIEYQVPTNNVNSSKVVYTRTCSISSVYVALE